MVTIQYFLFLLLQFSNNLSRSKSTSILFTLMSVTSNALKNVAICAAQLDFKLLIFAYSTDRTIIKIMHETLVTLDYY